MAHNKEQYVNLSACWLSIEEATYLYMKSQHAITAVATSGSMFETTHLNLPLQQNDWHLQVWQNTSVKFSGYLSYHALLELHGEG